MKQMKTPFLLLLLLQTALEASGLGGGGQRGVAACGVWGRARVWCRRVQLCWNAHSPLLHREFYREFAVAASSRIITLAGIAHVFTNS